MTEEEWLSINDPQLLLNAIRGKATDRKFRLFACACCVFFGNYPFPHYQRFVESAKSYADGTISWQDLLNERFTFEREDESGLAMIIRLVALQSATDAAETLSMRVREFTSVADRDTLLLRDIIGNPFRPVEFSLSWATDTVLSLARHIYTDQEFSAMPILADALQDAGCDNADILDHCRGQGPHVRGCWVVDMILGKW